MFSTKKMNSKNIDNWFRKRKELKANFNAESLFEKIKTGDIQSLSLGITLLESSLTADSEEAQLLIQKALPYVGKSIRIGITGVPGVGKSSFIEAFGLHLISLGKKVAVLAIDPSSEKTHGSILGDKTRMELLSRNKNAFIRPSSAGDSLGGVARKTRESTYLCELAGFDIILIETVGVGQSETSVHSMVDFFLLLMLAGAGDELQGIKRGIMEMADLLVVTKADGENLEKAKIAQRSYQNAMHLFPPNPNNWIAKTSISSILNSESISDVSTVIFDFEKQMKENQHFYLKRKSQDKYWFEESLKSLILARYYRENNFKIDLKKYQDLVMNGKISSFEAAQLVFEKHSKHGKN